MNYIFLLIELVLTFLLLIIFYKYDEKEGLFHYISLLSSILGLIIYKSFDILSFDVNVGLSLVVGIFICSNIIVQKYGNDELPFILKAFIYPFILVTIVLGLSTYLTGSELNLVANNNFDSLFTFSLNNLRVSIGFMISISFMLWLNVNVYYYLRKNKNNYIYSNLYSALIVQFFESIIFILISYIGIFDINSLVGMISIRYLLKVLIGVIGLIPVKRIIKMKV